MWPCRTRYAMSALPLAGSALGLSWATGRVSASACASRCLRQSTIEPRRLLKQRCSTISSSLQRRCTRRCACLVRVAYLSSCVLTLRASVCSYYDVLCELLMTQLRDGGLAVIGGKRYYFGTGGGTESFAVALSKTGVLECTVARVFDDGKSNIREMLLVRRLPSPAQRPLHEQQDGVSRDNDVSMD